MLYCLKQSKRHIKKCFFSSLKIFVEGGWLAFSPILLPSYYRELFFKLTGLKPFRQGIYHLIMALIKHEKHTTIWWLLKIDKAFSLEGNLFWKEKDGARLNGMVKLPKSRLIIFL